MNEPFMTPLPQRFFYAGPVLGVVLDWAGTTVDYGCRGPAAVFVETFREFGICVSPAEARQFMGLAKKDHIRAMCGLSSVKAQWMALHGRVPEEIDIDTIYARTEPMMVYPLEAMVKIGDTVSDIQEGLNAGMWTIGITRTGNEMGLSLNEVNLLPELELTARLATIENRFQAAGAHYTVESMGDILPVIDEISDRLSRSEHPLHPS